ncbi:MAG: hypothetical protein EPN25_12160 [Nitrospirae bacterium]|nr:MAG: hypothetical protein EPN25_12160 [Nitrospirota bacterium]
MKQLKNYYRGMAVISLLLILAAAGTAFGESSYSGTGVLYLSQVDTSGAGLYEVFLKAVDKNGQEFVVQSSTPFVSGQPSDATFDQATGVLHISDLEIVLSGSFRNHVSVDMLLQPGSDPMRFRVTSVIAQNLPYSAGNTLTGIIGPNGNIVGGSGGYSVSEIGLGLYSVDFGTDVSGFVCSCTPSLEEVVGPPIQNQQATGIGISSCIIIKGAFFGGPTAVLFGFPGGSSGFHFICVRS